MAYYVPHMPNYAFVIIRLKISRNANDLSGSLMYHYGENDDALPIGGLVKLDAILMGNALRHYRHLVNYRFEPNDCLYLINVLNDFMNHEPVQI
jgi:hypothetical protein